MNTERKTGNGGRGMKVRRRLFGKRGSYSKTWVSLLLLLTLLFSACGNTVPAFSLPPLESDSLPVTADPMENPDAEVRGVWIASVYNINYPSRPGLRAEELAAELDDILSTCLDTGLNAVYFQVRPSGDALYKSDIFPVSAYLSGTQGTAADGDFDPLAYLIAAAHREGIAVHAWVNPLRVTVGSAAEPQTDVTALAETNPARQHPEYTVAYADGRLYYDPGQPEVRRLIADGVREIVERYPVDGVVFDDYFYPYGTYINLGGNQVLADFDDLATYKEYGGALSLADWRRENINQLVRGCYDAVKSADPDCLFGVAPFGIWQNDNGENGGSDTRGMESYSSIFCDSLAFIRGGYVDYIAPQLYWNFSTSVARYDTLVRWWNAQVQGTGVDLLICHGVYRYEDMEDPDREILRQIEYARAENNFRGSIHYGYASIKNNTKGLRDELKQAYSREVVCAPLLTGGNFLISSPQSGTVIDADFSYLIGSADPASTVLFEGKPVSLTRHGCFSVQVKLEEGENTFTFLCDGREYTHTLFRRSPSEGGYTVMDSFRISSCYPTERVTVQSGNTVSLSCTAPTGSLVTASLGNRTVTLSPILGNTGPERYIAELYRGTITLEGSEPLASLGALTFTAERDGETASAVGAEIRVLGEGYGIPVTVTRDYALLKKAPDSSFYDDYTPQVVGMCETAVAEKEGYYLLSMGGWICADDVQTGECALLPGETEVRQLFQTVENGDAVFYVKAADCPALSGQLVNGKFVLTVFNSSVTDTSVTRDAPSSLVVSARLEGDEDAGCVRLVLELADTERFYGFRFAYTTASGVSLIKLTLNGPPPAAEGAQPLAGKRIVLDAGHGGIDPGALGAFGIGSGKNEADINLAIVLSLRDKLVSLGAEVLLTRDSDITLELEDRERFLLETDPDLSVAVHQNSMPYATDISKVRGVAAFYCADSGRLLARSLSDKLGETLGRGCYEPRWLTLMLCRNHRFVSALVETGFMTSMEEYERMLTDEGIESTAQGLCDGILAFFARAAEN